MRGRRSATVAVAALMTLAPAAGAAVLRVGSYKGIPGQYTTIQAAIDKAKPGDWILVGPGDYKTRSPRAVVGGNQDAPAGLLVKTARLHLRGMNRNTVVVDGTKPGSAKCSAKKSAQNFGPHGWGLNGILVWKARDVSVENMTACNFLGGSYASGNGFWWNGGDNSGKVGGHGYSGAYLTATSTFFDPNDTGTAAQYGIFSSNWSGGTWDQTYASNFNDSGYYIGACRQICDQVINHAHGAYNALGYSGTNSGGSLVIKNSEFDHNEDGFDTNSQNADQPSPQNGACPHNGISPITHTHSCWVFINNYVHDNNNPNVPAAGSAAAGPVGTGISISGARNDTVMNNRFVNNAAWAIILVPYPDSGPPCIGGNLNSVLGAGTCLFSGFGIAVKGNVFSHNGSYGHPSNGDLGWVSLEAGHPTNCFSGNTGQGSPLSPDLKALEVAYPRCTGAPIAAGSSNPNFLAEVLCDSQAELNPGQPASCPTGQYPRRTKVVMHPLPKGLKTMPNPCAGVPHNPWCPAPKVILTPPPGGGLG